MFKKFLLSSLLLSFSFGFYSCASDDDYVPIVIESVPDIDEVSQNSSIEIDVLLNDTNVPTSGELTVSNPTNGAVAVLDPNNSPNDPSDDVVLYTPNIDFVGTDSFLYTICNNLDPMSCSTETVTVTVTPISPVNFNLAEMPYATLSEYNFFNDDLKDLNPVYGVLPYDLNSALFSDYAKKKRFVWMPGNVKAEYENDYSSFNFPVGAILIKNFYYENVQPDNNTKILETRLMIKKNSEWEFANYVWNEDQTEANLTSDGSFVLLDWVHDGSNQTVNYRIPARAECFTCHNKFGTPVPIGPKPQNINRDYNYSNGNQNQLQKWIEQGYLDDNLPSSIETTVNWKDDSEPIDLRARSYIDINCAHCHSEESYCEYRPMRFAFNENSSIENMGVCVEPDTNIDDALTHIISPNSPEESVVYFRVSSIEEQYRMPLLGRTLQHREGVLLIEQYINSLTNECE